MILLGETRSVLQLSRVYVQRQTSWGTEGKGGAATELSNHGEGHNGGRDGSDTPWKGATGSKGVVHHRRGRGCGMRDSEAADTEYGAAEVVPFRDLATFGVCLRHGRRPSGGISPSQQEACS